MFAWLAPSSAASARSPNLPLGRAGGAVYKQLCSSTAVKAIIIDSEAPPNEAADVRLVVLVGPPACVTAANAQVEHLIRTASEKRGQKRGFDGVSQLQPPSCYG